MKKPAVAAIGIENDSEPPAAAAIEIEIVIAHGAKNRLQEIYQSDVSSLVYTTTRDGGPDHIPLWKATVSFGDGGGGDDDDDDDDDKWCYASRTSHHTKIQAQQDAAQQALTSLGLVVVGGDGDGLNCKMQLQERCQKKWNGGLPEYRTTREADDVDHDPHYRTTVILPDDSKHIGLVKSTKKAAQTSAAQAALYVQTTRKSAAAAPKCHLYSIKVDGS